MTPPKNAKVIDFKSSTIWFDEDGILYSVSKQDVPPPRTLEESKVIIEEFKKILKGKKVCMLLQSRNSTPPSREMREYFGAEFPKFTKAIAMLAPSPLTKMVANLFFTIKKQPYPTKFFTDENEAREWLKQYLRQ